MDSRTYATKAVIVDITALCIEKFIIPQVKLKEWLDENNYSYQEHNVAEDKESANKMIERTGQRGVPQTFIGDTEIIGFQPDKIEEVVEQV